MQGKKESYKYQDGRDFRFEDGRHKPGYMSLYRDEFLHLYRTCSKTAIGLYAFVGTTVSGNAQGFNVGSKILQEELGAGRSTLYEALGQLVEAGLVERTSLDGRTVIRLVDVWKSRNLDSKVSEISDNSRPRFRTNRENNSIPFEDDRSPLPPRGETASYRWVSLISALRAILNSSGDIERLHQAYLTEDASVLPQVMAELASANWQGTYRKRDLLKAMRATAHQVDISALKSRFEEQHQVDAIADLEEHIENLKVILKRWESSQILSDMQAADKTRLQISQSEQQLADLLAP